MCENNRLQKVRRCEGRCDRRLGLCNFVLWPVAFPQKFARAHGAARVAARLAEKAFCALKDRRSQYLLLALAPAEQRRNPEATGRPTLPVRRINDCNHQGVSSSFTGRHGHHCGTSWRTRSTVATKSGAKPGNSLRTATWTSAPAFCSATSAKKVADPHAPAK